MNAYLGIVILLALTTCPAFSARAQDIDERAMDLVIAGKNCPSAPIGQASICQKIRDSCAADVSWECDAKARACGARERELNAKINIYNSIYYACERGKTDRKDAETKTRPSSGGESELSRALKQQKEKASNADEVNKIQQRMERRQQQRQLEEAAQRERIEEERKNREAQKAIDEARERERLREQEAHRRDMAEAATHITSIGMASGRATEAADAISEAGRC
jgi:hypothetical protein